LNGSLGIERAEEVKRLSCKIVISEAMLSAVIYVGVAILVFSEVVRLYGPAKTLLLDQPRNNTSITVVLSLINIEVGESFSTSVV
jgi:hypothetical protein